MTSGPGAAFTVSLAMNLDLRRLRKEQKAIRRLITLGAAITFAGGALGARLILG